MHNRNWLRGVWVAAVLLMGSPPLVAGPWGHKRCPPPQKYSPWTYWAAGARRLSVLYHHRPVYQYPSDPYHHLPRSYLRLPYPCPPVDPDRFYGELLGGRDASSRGGLALPEPAAGQQPTTPETLPPPTRRPDTPPDGM